MPTLAPDLLSSIVAFLQGTTAITNLLNGGFGYGGFGQGGFGGIGNSQNRIFSDKVPAGMLPPYIVIHGYKEAEPGESVDDSQSEGVICVIANDYDQAFLIGKTLKNYVDVPTMNKNAISRPPFSFVDGVEFSNRRERPSMGRIPGQGINGFYCYEYVLPYTFFIDPML
jgi:hypothetical protein